MSMRGGGLFVGRLLPDSGIGTLVEALDLFPGVTVDVVGVGPQAAQLRGHPRLRLHGRLPSEDLRSVMQRAAYLVAPHVGAAAEPQPMPP